MSDAVPSPQAHKEAQSAHITDAEAAAMLRAAINLFRHWELNDEQARILLGSPSARTYARWKSGDVKSVPHDTASRLSMLMGIHKSLRYMFKEPARGYAWLRKDNAAFGGKSALARMLAGEAVDVAAVRAYLDAERGGW